MVRQASGERPGALIQVNLLEATFQLDRFDLTRYDLFGLLDAAQVVHARESRAAWIRTVNPFYWLDMALAVVEVVPFLPLRLLGKDPSRAARTRGGVAVRFVVRVGALVALAAGLLADLGLTEEARSSSMDLIARIRAVIG